MNLATLPSFFRCQSSENSAVGKLSIPLGGDVGHQVIDNRVYGREIFSLPKKHMSGPVSLMSTICFIAARTRRQSFQ